jgi:glucosylceramidase
LIQANYTIGNWGAYYAKAIIRDLNAGAVAWTDWNIFLNQNGGPNHKGNFCFAPVHVNTEAQKITYTKAYYSIGHFSKFILPGAKRVACSLSNSFLETTAFQNPDGTCVLVVLNDTNKNIIYKMFLGAHFIQLDSKPNSIQTILF